MLNNKYYFMLDVESVGLTGQPFAYGVVVIDNEGIEIESYYECVDISPNYDEFKWVIENVITVCPVNLNYLSEDDKEFSLGLKFISLWDYWQEKGAVMVADIPFPVETNFLMKIKERYPKFELPYPLLDSASVLLAAGYDPTGKFPRKKNELPIHNPEADARQSARLFIEAIQMLRFF